MEHQIETKPTKKRAHSSNWDEEEKRLLRQLIIEKNNIIEKKDCSTNTHAQKKAAWQEILSSFNSLNNKQRDLTQLITQWRNTKGQVKSRESEYRRARLMAGGGPPPPSSPPEDLEIIQSIPNEFVVDSNAFDSDSAIVKTIKQSHTAEIKNVHQPELEVPPILSSVNVILDYEKSIELVNPEAEIQITPLASTSETDLRNKNNIKRKLYKPSKKQTKMDDYEHQLFLVTKKAKENKDLREEEIHKKRKEILELERQYWEKKLKMLD